MLTHRLSALFKCPDGPWRALCSCGHESAACESFEAAQLAQKYHAALAAPSAERLSPADAS